MKLRQENQIVVLTTTDTGSNHKGIIDSVHHEANVREIGTALDVASRGSWRNWLKENHAIKKEALLIIYKKGLRNTAFSPSDALQEALCFGWIDGWFKPIDANRWVIRYSPRRKGSSWSRYNIARAWQLLREGKMTPTGIAKVPSDVIRIWEDYHPSPIIIDSKGARKGEVRFTDGKDYFSMIGMPALTPKRTMSQATKTPRMKQSRS